MTLEEKLIEIEQQLKEIYTSYYAIGKIAHHVEERKKELENLLALQKQLEQAYEQ